MTKTDEKLDPETIAEQLDSVEQYLEYLQNSNPYYSLPDAEVIDVERGVIRAKQPHSDRIRPPEVGPASGINGGI